MPLNFLSGEWAHSLCGKLGLRRWLRPSLGRSGPDVSPRGWEVGRRIRSREAGQKERGETDRNRGSGGGREPGGSSRQSRGGPLSGKQGSQAEAGGALCLDDERGSQAEAGRVTEGVTGREGLPRQGRATLRLALPGEGLP